MKKIHLSLKLWYIHIFPLLFHNCFTINLFPDYSQTLHLPTFFSLFSSFFWKIKDGQTDWQTDGQTERQTDRQTDSQTDRQTGRKKANDDQNLSLILDSDSILALLFVKFHHLTSFCWNSKIFGPEKFYRGWFMRRDFLVLLLRLGLVVKQQQQLKGCRCRCHW